MPKYIERTINPRQWTKTKSSDKNKSLVEDSYFPGSGCFDKEEVETTSRKRNKKTD